MPTARFLAGTGGDSHKQVWTWLGVGKARGPSMVKEWAWDPQLNKFDQAQVWLQAMLVLSLPLDHYHHTPRSPFFKTPNIPTTTQTPYDLPTSQPRSPNSYTPATLGHFTPTCFV